MGVIETIRLIYKHEGGIKGFFKGLVPKLMLVLNPIINFVTYETLKQELINRNIPQTAANLFIISSISKSLATIITYPILTIRVRL